MHGRGGPGLEEDVLPQLTDQSSPILHLLSRLDESSRLVFVRIHPLRPPAWVVPNHWQAACRLGNRLETEENGDGRDRDRAVLAGMRIFCAYDWPDGAAARTHMWPTGSTGTDRSLSDMIQETAANLATNTTPTEMEAECGSCPWVDHALADCRSRFQLKDIERAMATCFGDWSSCAVYRAMMQEGSKPEREMPVPVILTVRQHDHVPLRPTGS